MRVTKMKTVFFLVCIALTFAGESNYVHSEATNTSIGDENATDLVKDTGGAVGDLLNESSQVECVDSEDLFEVPGNSIRQSCDRVRISNNTKELCMLPEILTNCMATCNRRCISATPATFSARKSAGPSKSKKKKSTQAPSEIPSSIPSHYSTVPSTQPSQCEDAEDWKMPDDSIWKNTPLTGLNCTELEALSSPSKHQEWCKFLSQGIFTNMSPEEACCFCGRKWDEKANCQNIDGWTMLTGSNIDCEFIENVDDPTHFCNEMSNTSFSTDGFTAGSACCICGGGTKRTQSEGRRLEDEIDPKFMNILEDETPGTEEKFIDFIYRTGLGESEGIPNLEFLGLGYHSLYGNPRGTDATELDPGFRYRVLKLKQNQNDLSVDGKYTVPVGTEFRYTSSCKYDSSSTEVSSTRDLRASLQQEATFTKSTSSQVGGGVDFLGRSLSARLSSKFSFSLSGKFSLTSSSSSSKDSVSFESRAICSEYEVSFNPYYLENKKKEGILDYRFMSAMSNLPVPFDKENLRHVNAYTTFVEAYGTHYIKKLVLGGKRIHTTTMSSSDYASLVSTDVDVSSTLSFEMSAAMGSSQHVKAGMVKAVASAATKFGGGKGKMIGNAINIALNDTPNDEKLFGYDVDANTSNSFSQFARTKIQAESSFKIAKKKLTTSEVNVGGLPNEDWRQWAESVKEKPMPIRYELSIILDFMSYELQVAFVSAVDEIFNLDLRGPPIEKDFPDNYYFGVYKGSGKPISGYTTKPRTSYRALMQVQEIANENRLVYKPFWNGKLNRPAPYFFTKISRAVGAKEIEEQAPFYFNYKAVAADQTPFLDYHSFFPFVSCAETYQSCNITMTDYLMFNSTDAFRQKETSFSMLAMDDVKNNFIETISGVVDYDSVALNTMAGRPPFRVEESFDQYGELFLVTFDDEDFVPNTIILSARTEENEIPKSVRDISLYIDKTTGTRTNQFVVRSSSGDWSPDGTKFGFNFLAFDGTNPSKYRGIKHGFIDIHSNSTEKNFISPSFNATLEENDDFINEQEINVWAFHDYCYEWNETSYNNFIPFIDYNSSYFQIVKRPVKAKGGGVRVKFAAPFAEIPSVIATPVYTGEVEVACRQKAKLKDDLSEVYREGILQCLVETITTEECFVKCVCIIETITLEDTCGAADQKSFDTAEFELVSIPFNLVVVGPSIEQPV